MIDGLSINRFIFVIFLLLSLMESDFPSCLEIVVMLPDEELYDSTKKLFLSSFSKLLIFEDLKDFPDDAKWTASNIDVFPTPFFP